MLLWSILTLSQFNFSLGFHLGYFKSVLTLLLFYSIHHRLADQEPLR